MTLLPGIVPARISWYARDVSCLYANLINSAGYREEKPMADEANKPLDADEISEDDLQKVAGGSTPLNVPKITVIGSLPNEPAPTQSKSGETPAGWDLPVNSAE
jgi:hypothetical protein